MGNLLDQQHHATADRLDQDFADGQAAMQRRHDKLRALTAAQLARKAAQQLELSDHNPPVQVGEIDTSHNQAA